MKKLLLSIAAVFTLTVSTAAQSHQGVYVGGLGGVNLLDINEHYLKTDPGFTLGAVAGYAWCKGFRAEAEASYRHNKYTFHHSELERVKLRIDGNCRRWSFMANGYYDINLCDCVTPYVGIGIGYDYIHAKHRYHHKEFGLIAIEKGEGNSFAWQCMAGASYNFCDDWDIALEYKFHGSRYAEYNHAITVGVHKYFGWCF